MIHRLNEEDLPRLEQFWIQHWGQDAIVARSDVIGYDEVEGFIFGDWIGLITFIVTQNECEVISFDSLEEGKGIGTSLMNEVVHEANKRNCKRVHLITTNDNLNALKFYQKYGFELVQINRNAVDEARKIKPSIPLIGMHGIPLRDEIELELSIANS